MASPQGMVKFAQLHTMSDEHLRDAYDSGIGADRPEYLSFWLDELRRRENARAAKRMERLTWAATLAAAASVVVAVAALIVAL